MAVEPLRDVTFGDATNRLVSVTFEKKTVSQESISGDENRAFFIFNFFLPHINARSGRYPGVADFEMVNANNGLLFVGRRVWSPLAYQCQARISYNDGD